MNTNDKLRELIRSPLSTGNPAQVEPVEGLAEAIMWHIERVCGPLNTENCEVDGDNDRDVLRHNIIATLSPRIAQQAEVQRLDLDSVHTCHDQCQRLPCVQQREIARLREALSDIVAEIQFPNALEAGFVHSGPTVRDMRRRVEVVQSIATAALNEQPGAVRREGQI